MGCKSKFGGIWGCDVRRSPIQQASLFCADSHQPCWLHPASASFVVLQAEGFITSYSLSYCSVRQALDFLLVTSFCYGLLNPMLHGFKSRTGCKISDLGGQRSSFGSCKAWLCHLTKLVQIWGFPIDNWWCQAA